MEGEATRVYVTALKEVEEGTWWGGGRGDWTSTRRSGLRNG